MSTESAAGKNNIRLISVTARPLQLDASAEAGPPFQVQEAPRSARPWEAAYEEYARRGDESYIEAEIPQEVPFRRQTTITREEEFALSASPTCVVKPQSPTAQVGPEAGWHLGARFSQLAQARAFAALHNTLGRRVRIAHIDTGYDKSHHALPPRNQILRDLSRDFTQNPATQFADDPGGLGFPIDNRGHGAATLCILAGGPIPILSNQPLGGAPEAEVLPLRVSERVVLLGTDALARAVHYAIDNGCDVITLSMGGVATKFWVDAYNRAYENGVFCVAAAGNHFKLGAQSITPGSTVYPALFNRVVSATGVMADGLPYDLPGAMSGNWGPHDKMQTALAASLAASLARYNDDREAWRRIDNQASNSASTLALQMDKYINNTSLALAFEFQDEDGKGDVLLFPGDAQVGNWDSWFDIKKEIFDVPDLLRRTIFYKVGHHGSHNATLKPALEQMTHPKLVAMIPTNEKFAKDIKHRTMPAPNLYKALEEHTGQRLLRNDQGVGGVANPMTMEGVDWGGLEKNVTVDRLYIDYFV